MPHQCLVPSAPWEAEVLPQDSSFDLKTRIYQGDQGCQEHWNHQYRAFLIKVNIIFSHRRPSPSLSIMVSSVFFKERDHHPEDSPTPLWKNVKNPLWRNIIFFLNISHNRTLQLCFFSQHGAIDKKSCSKQEEPKTRYFCCQYLDQN